MHRYLVVFSIALVGLVGAQRPVHAQDAKENADAAAVVAAAQPIAEAWLALFFDGRAEETWDQAGSHFQEFVVKEAWVQQAASLLSALGKPTDRKFVEAEPMTDPVNFPPGEYVVLTYSASFTDFPTAREQIMLVREDGTWKVIGYSVHPVAG